MLKKLLLGKNYLLAGGTILLFVVSYFMAFKKTIAVWQLNNELREKLSQTANVSFQPGYLESKNKNLDYILSFYKIDTTTLRNNMINIISLIANQEDVKLSEVPIQNLNYDSDQFVVESLRFEGDYFSLMRLSERLQHAKDIGVIRSQDWKIITLNINGAKVTKLSLELLLECSKR